jgi:hypothetical protein
MKFKNASTCLFAEILETEYHPGNRLLLGILNLFYVSYTRSMEILLEYLTNVH